MPTTSDNKLDLLYKKFIGIPLSNPSGAAASEAAGSSKSKIIPSLQIFSQSIPSTAPSDLSNVTFTPANSGGTKQISASNTHIAKYTQLGLSEVQPQISYRYANPSVSTNLTSPAIPGNYDIAGSTYAITLYGSDGTTVINPSTYPWVFDTDSGYVTFIDPASLLPISLAPPKITFWRYEGTFGLSSGDLSSNGNLFIAYDTSLNSRLVVGSDVTVNKRLFIGGDASLNGNLTIGKDLTINGRLNVHNYTNQNIINTTTTNYTLIVSEDLSLNGRFVVSGDSSMNGNLYIAGTLSAANFAANSIPSSAIIGGVGSGGSGSSSGAVTGDLSSNGNLFIAYDTSLNSRLVVGSDVTVNKRLFILGDVSMNGSLYVADNITTVTQDISDNSTKVATTAFVKNVLDASFSNYYAKSDIDSSLNLKAPIASPTFTGIATIPIANIDNLTTSADANINGNLIVNNGYLRIQNLPIGLNNIGSSISIGIDALINNTGSNNIAIGKNSSSGMISGKQNIAIGVNAMQLNVNGNNNIALGSYSLNNNSHGHNNVAIGINSGDMDISGNNNTYLGSDTNVDNNDNVYSFSTAIGSESVITASNQIMLGRLIGTEHVVIPGDLSLNLGMSVGGDSSMNGNLYVSGSITSLTQNISDNSTKVATTAFVKNVLDASLGNLSNYYTKSVIDASLNEYYTKSTIDASLGNYYTKSVIDASLGEYYTKSVIDASLGEYYTKSVIDASLGEYYTKSAVDSSFNLKAPIDSPTFTGIATIPTVNITNLNTVGDSSLNGNVTISKDLTINGILNVKNYTNQNIINTTTTNYQLIVSEDLSLNGRLIVSSDVSMNNNLFVNGNITTQTLPTSDNSTKVATTEFVKNQNYSTISYVDSSLNNLKTYVDNSLNLKSSITYVDSSLNTLQTYTDSSLNLKSSITYVDSSLNTLQTYTDSSLNLKSSITYVDSSLNTLKTYADSSFNLKASIDSPTFTGTAIIPTANITTLNTIGDSSMNGNVVIGKDLTINGRLNVQANTIPANAIIGGVSTSSSAGDFTANGNLIVTGNITGNLNAVSNGNVDSINFWTLTKYMNSMINAPPAVTFGNVDTLSTMIRIPWTYPTQYNIGIADTLIPVIKTLTITYSITKSGGAIQNGTIINALNTNSYIKSSLSDTYPITGVVLLKSGSTTGYNSNYTFTDGNRNAYVFTDSNIQGLTTNDTLTLNVYYTNNNTSTNTASKPSLNFVAAGTPSAPVYRSSTPSTTSVTITIGNPQYGDANNTTTNTTITTYRVNYSSISNATRFYGVKPSGLQTIDTSVSVTPTGTANTISTTTGAISTNIYPETTYTANISAINNVNSSVGAYSGNFTFTTTPFSIPSYNWLYGNGVSASTLSFGLPPFVTGYYNNTTSSVNTLLLNLSSTYTTSSMTTIINDYERRGVYGAGNSTTISANVVLNGSVTTGPSVSLDANVGYTTVPSANTVNNITITPSAVADNYAGNSIGYDGYYNKYTGTVSLASGLFAPSPYPYTVNLTRTSGNVNATKNSSYSFYYDTITGVPGNPSITAFNINTTSYSQVCGIYVISAATFTASYSVTNLGKYFYKPTPIAYNSTGTIGTIISANESTIPYGNVYGNLMIYNPVSFNQTITSSSLTNVFSNIIPLTITATNFIGSVSANASAINAIIDGPSVSLLSTISDLNNNIISNTGGQYNGTRYYAGANPDNITSNNNSITNGSLFSQLSAVIYNHTQSIQSGTYGKELQIANGNFVTKSSTISGSLVGYQNYDNFKYNSTTSNTLDYSGISSSGYRYACFAWKYSYSLAASNISFTMNSSNGFVRGNTSGTFNPLTAGGSNIIFYYKIEDSTGGSGVTSYWINGNDTTGGLSQVGSSNYNKITNLHGIPDTFTSTGTNDSNIFKVLTVNPGSGYSSNTILYCIIGLPMNANCYFDYIKASIN